MKDSKHTEKVERYILNQMSESEKIAFQTELLFDKNIQQEVKMMRQLQKTVVTNNKPTSGSKLGKVFTWGITIVMIIALASFLISSMDKTEAVETEVPTIEGNSDTETALKPVSNRTDTEVLVPPKIEDIQEVEKNEPKQVEKPKRTQEKIPAESSSKPQLIAANYEANTLIESEFGTSLRGNYAFNITAPKTDESFSLQENQLNWMLEGSLETTKRPEQDFSLLLEIYTNESELYKASKPLVQSPIALEEVEESVYHFTYQQALNVDLRLYYYLLRDDFTGAVLAGGRFKVTL